MPTSGEELDRGVGTPVPNGNGDANQHHRGSTSRSAVLTRIAQLDKVLNGVERELNEDNYSLTDLEDEKTHLTKELRRYTHFYDDLELEEGMDEECCTADADLRERVTEIKLKIGQQLKTLRSEVRQSNNKTETFRRSSLYKINVPMFDGTSEGWPLFWETVDSTIKAEPGCSSLDKILFLRRHCPAEIQTTIDTRHAAGGSFENIVENLKDWFDDPEELMENLILKFLNLKSVSYTQRSLVELRSNYEKTIGLAMERCDQTELFQYMVKTVLLHKILPKEFNAHLNHTLRKKHFSLEEVTTEMRNCIKFLDDTGFEKMKNNKPQNNQASSSQKPFQQDNAKGKLTIAQGRTYRQCLFCESSDHESHMCGKFDTVPKRKAQLEKLNRCTNCAKRFHTASKCDRTEFKCYECSGKHHPVFCLVKKAGKGSGPSKTVRFCAANEGVALRSVALPTATGQVIGQGATLKTRIFFDLGAQTSIITRSFAKELNIRPTESTHMAISGLFVSKQARKYGIARFQLELGEIKKEIMAIILDMPAFTISVPGLTNAVKVVEGHGFKMADREITSDQLSDVHLSLGGDYFHDIVTEHTQINGVHVCKTPAGWMISGAIDDPTVESNGHRRSETMGIHALTLEVGGKQPVGASFSFEEDFETGFGPNTPVHKLWDLDVIGISPLEISPTDVAAHDHFRGTVKYDSGQYWVRLPWRADAPPLPSHFGLAMARLRNQRRWLLQKDLLDTYHGLINEMLEADFIEEAPNSDSQDAVHYLPHSSVVKDSATTPIRIVFDASARLGAGPSLNDCLLTGPTLTGHIVETILRFRTGIYAYSADISKAFLRIGLQEGDRDYTRFLWLKDPYVPKLEPIPYRFKSVLFGACCSPFLLQATIDYHLQHSDDPLAEILRRSFYVDNLQGGGDDGEFLCQLYDSANRLLQQANMPLRMWVSNNPDLIDRIRTYDPDYMPPETTHLLGQQWDVANDLLGFKLPVWIDGPLTKKTLLSKLHAVFDPLGILSPLTIRGKLLLKEAWAAKLGWDDPLSEVFIHQWSKLAGDLVKVNEIWVPRTVCTEEGFKELHVFCDASTKAYGAACYGISRFGARIVMAKAKPAPHKRTLPELEILAVEVGVKLVQFVEKAMNKPLDTVYVWTDSEVALQWIRNNKSDKVFVKNRVKTIRDIAENYEFQHVASKGNPADKLTRGITGKEFATCNLWFNGPEWILDESKWPRQKPQIVSVHVARVEESQSQPLVDLSRFSTFYKLLTATRFALQAATNWLNTIRRPLSSDWNQDALSFLIKQDQRQFYGTELDYLQGGKGPAPPLVTKLGLYVDDGGLIRCRGRIQATNADIDPEPILLVRRSKFTKLVIKHHHGMAAHGGVNQTLTYLKVKYYIPKARVTVKQVIHDCIVCQVFSARPYRYPGPPSLPQERVAFQRPFQSVGVDYTGAITLANNVQVSSKFYVCLFTCTATRAVHLELVGDLSAATFMLALRQFIGRRGCPRTIITDNASCFRASSDFLKNLRASVELEEFLTIRAIDWQFIPPRSPWFGGFYERLIGLFKNSLKRVLYRKTISIDELRTVLCEIELHINNRPLTYVSDDVNDPIPISPAHLIYGRQLEPFPSPMDEEILILDPGHQNVQEGFQRVNQLLQHWIKVWGKDYLTSLREKHYGASAATQSDPPKEGDIVLVSGPGSRSHWPLGRILELVPDREGITRIVKVLVNGKVVLKTIDKLIPLEITRLREGGEETDAEASSEALQPSPPSTPEVSDAEDLEPPEPNPIQETVEPSSSRDHGRPRRRAAVEAETERQNLLRSHQL